MKVLVVEENPSSAISLVRTLEKGGYEARAVSNLADVLQLARGGWPDIILLDSILSDGVGSGFCRQLGEDQRTQHIPVAIMTPDKGAEARAVGFRNGAVDYIILPLHPTELLARVGILARIKKAEDEVRSSMSRDPLTGLYNRRFLSERLPEEAHRANRYKQPLSLFICDIDQFQAIGDQFGRGFGDRAILAVARLLNDVLRSTDMVSRWGHDEFAAVLPHTGLDGAATAAWRLVKIAREAEIHSGESHARLSLSIGVAPLLDQGKTPAVEAHSLLEHAESCLSTAKQEGCDRVVAVSLGDAPSAGAMLT